MSASSLPVLQRYLNQYGMPICLILGNIGNTFIIFILKKRQQNACSMYLLNAAIMNIIFLTFNILLLTYTYNYGDPTSQSLIFCKLRRFLLHVVGQISRYFIVLACIDRFAVTSLRAGLRTLSQPAKARNLMIILSIILFLCAIHIFIFTTIKNGRCGQFPPYYNYYLAYIILFTSTIPPLTMTIFGYLSYRNLKLSHGHMQSIANTTNHSRNNLPMQRRDQELLIMVSAEVFVYVITMSIYPIILFEVAITNNMNIKKSADYLAIENFIMFISYFSAFINNAAPFYIYLIASTTFRQSFIKLFKHSKNVRIKQQGQYNRYCPLITREIQDKNNYIQKLGFN